MFFKKDKSKRVFEENIFIQSFGSKISKQLEVFYNPVMKLNRDISLLVITSYFDKKIKFCDPMAASGIRELRFLKTVPECFQKLVVGDISKVAINNIKRNFKANKISTKKLVLNHANAINTINLDYFDFIEIDPFGSPVPFLDIGCQRIKHNGILSVTATDTAALCGTYPKTTLRKYNIKVIKTHYHEELGLRNLIAYCIRQGAKYEKNITPLVSYSNNHYFKVFFKVEESRSKSYESVKGLKYITWDKKSQMTKEIGEWRMESGDEGLEIGDEFVLMGKTYVGKLNDKEFLSKMSQKCDLISQNKEVLKLIDSLIEEIDVVGYYNPHKFQKEFKFESFMKFETICQKLKEKGFLVSKPHNNRLGIKTNAGYKEFISVMKGE